MQKSQIKILIVEDDESLSRALETAVQRAGYSCQVANSYNQAKTAFSLSTFHGVICDCMLPQKSGIDLVQELNNESSAPLVVILTSGIFKDKGFAQDAKLRTRAQSFLFKPFDIQVLVQDLDQSFSHKIEIFKEPIFELLKSKNVSSREKLNALTQTSSFHGFDLPFVYSLLTDTQISGELEIQYDEKTKSFVEFSQGQIASVKHHDVESYFGALLVEKGFCSHQDIEKYLNIEKNKKIGEKLVEASLLSPHAIEIVHHDQMIIRMSKTIQDCDVQLRFNEKSIQRAANGISQLEFTQLLNDWLLSKVPTNWFVKFYSHWLDHVLVEGSEHNKLPLLSGLPILKAFSGQEIQNAWPKTLAEVIGFKDTTHDEALRSIHFLLLLKIFRLESKKSNTVNFELEIKRIKKIRETIATQNHFEIFNLNSKSKPSEIVKSYHNLAKTLHPDKLDPNAPASLVSMTQEVFAKITDAYQILTNDEKRKEYVTSLELGRAEDVLKAEALFDEGFQRLQTGRYREARKHFEKCMKMKGHRSDTMIYLIWALIREKRNVVADSDLAEKVISLFNQVPHEDRHSPQYFFVKGMQYDVIGDIRKAYSHFKHAYVMDPTLIDAKKEMSLLKHRYGQQKTTLIDDFSTVVNKMLKKKTG